MNGDYVLIGIVGAFFAWRVLSPLLARRRRVIVPDCRGHGQSSNPNLT